MVDRTREAGAPARWVRDAEDLGDLDDAKRLTFIRRESVRNPSEDAKRYETLRMY